MQQQQFGLIKIHLMIQIILLQLGTMQMKYYRKTVKIKASLRKKNFRHRGGGNKKKILIRMQLREKYS